VTLLLRFLQPAASLPLLGPSRRERFSGLLKLGARSAVVGFPFRRLRLRGSRFCVGEKRAEPARLELALEPATAELFGCSIVDGGGLECLANVDRRKTEQALERLTLVLRRPGHVAFARELRVAECRRGGEVCLDLVTVLSHEPVDRARRRGRLAQRFDLVGLVTAPVLAQVGCRVVARLRELLDRERVEAVCDLVRRHLETRLLPARRRRLR
jgi:hypothetical protein